ncbi:MAG: DUF4381 domain-containing protein [Akkermansiaceae bacterium]
MSKSLGKLSELNDIVLPESVSWWPLAPGWYVLMVVGVCMLGFLGYRMLMKWRKEAYRREALQELAKASSDFQVCELLRRVALVIASREQVSRLHGAEWIEWLEGKYGSSVPEQAQFIITDGIYDSGFKGQVTENFIDFAESWIKTHQRPC